MNKSLSVLFPPDCFLLTKIYKLANMASSFTRLISSRNTAVLLVSLGAGTMATGLLLSENGSLAAEAKKKLYPPRSDGNAYIQHEGRQIETHGQGELMKIWQRWGACSVDGWPCWISDGQSSIIICLISTLTDCALQCSHCFVFFATGAERWHQ